MEFKVYLSIVLIISTAIIQYLKDRDSEKNTFLNQINLIIFLVGAILYAIDFQKSKSEVIYGLYEFPRPWYSYAKHGDFFRRKHFKGEEEVVVSIWNDGEIDIKNDEMRRDFVFKFENAIKILDYKILKSSGNKFSNFVLDTINNNSLSFTFNKLFVGQGMCFKVRILTNDLGFLKLRLYGESSYNTSIKRLYSIHPMINIFIIMLSISLSLFIFLKIKNIKTKKITLIVIFTITVFFLMNSCRILNKVDKQIPDGYYESFINTYDALTGHTRTM